jgi:hypothetical protein
VNILKFAPFPSSDVANYRVYRSIIGFTAVNAAPGAVAGKTLQLKMNGGVLQTISFSGVATVPDQINLVLTGGRAYPNTADLGATFLLRSDIREAPGSVEIVGGSSLVDLDTTARVITETSEDEVIATIPALIDPEELVEFEDLDGALQDFYAIQTIDSFGNLSFKTGYRQAIQYTGNICVVEGIVTDLQGVRYVDAEVKAKLIKFPHSPEKASQVTLGEIITRTGPDGRFSLPLLQGALVQFEIRAVGFNRNITVPLKAYEFITDILVDLDYRYPLEFV